MLHQIGHGGEGQQARTGARTVVQSEAVAAVLDAYVGRASVRLYRKGEEVVRVAAVAYEERPLCRACQSVSSLTG